MGRLSETIMQQLYGRNIWRDFTPNNSSPTPIEGWNGEHPALGKLASIDTIRTIVDVGTWKGQSTIFMAKALRERDGCVVAIDTFLGSPEHWAPGTSLFSTFMGRPNLYDTFLNNVAHHGLSAVVVPFPQTSLAAAEILRSRGITADLIHIDAAHDYTSVLADAESYWQLLAPDGFLIGDDYDATWPDVIRAADQFAAAHNVELMLDHPKWIIQKTRIEL